MSKYDNLRSKHEVRNRKKVGGGQGFARRMMRKLQDLKAGEADGTTSIPGVHGKKQE